MEKFENSTEATHEIMDALNSLPEEKLAMFFFNLFGFEALDEMAFELIEAQIDSGRMEIRTGEDVTKFVNTMII